MSSSGGMTASMIALLCWGIMTPRPLPVQAARSSCISPAPTTRRQMVVPPFQGRICLPSWRSPNPQLIYVFPMEPDEGPSHRTINAGSHLHPTILKSRRLWDVWRPSRTFRTLSFAICHSRLVPRPALRFGVDAAEIGGRVPIFAPKAPPGPDGGVPDRLRFPASRWPSRPLPVRRHWRSRHRGRARVHP